ncbi:AAA-domain-containing protein [Flagelloscypha sp. PMI_526]|nr:AAA-domain-containing protein [Flagelloscypha sp. PMI_526]
MMATKPSFLINNAKPIMDISLVLVSAMTLFYTYKWVLDPTSVGFGGSGKKKVKGKSLEILQSMGVDTSDMMLDEHESQLASTSLLHPSQLTTAFSSVGGLDPIVASLRESVIYPLQHPELFSGHGGLVKAPKGVLLYGPPGCGKTMLARALAKESGACFLNVSPSFVTSKWFGESNKLVSALFTLAHKLQPCIIFIDEIDCFLRSRSDARSGGGEHEAMSMVKSEFMTSWDGLLSSDEGIMILGATNRPQDIDPAILRRMPKKYSVPLPNVVGRERILEVVLKGANVDENVSLSHLSRLLDGYSGSGIREVCRAAALRPVRERLRSLQPGENLAPNEILRPINMDDFVISLREDKDGAPDVDYGFSDAEPLLD